MNNLDGKRAEQFNDTFNNIQRPGKSLETYVTLREHAEDDPGRERKTKLEVP